MQLYPTDGRSTAYKYNTVQLETASHNCDARLSVTVFAYYDI